MAWRYHGHARVDPRSPRAFGVCDRCGRLFNLVDLKFQYEWRGSRLGNTQLLVCKQDLDKPFPFFRPIILPPDPEAVRNPRPEEYAAEMGPTPDPNNPTLGDTTSIWDAGASIWDGGLSPWDVMWT